MPRTGENIYKRKDGRWEGRFIRDHRPNGKAMYGYVYAHTYKDVKEKLGLAISGKARVAEKKASDAAFSDISEEWLASQKSKVKESTYNRYHNILKLYVQPKLGNMYIEKITGENINKLCDELLSSGGKNGNGLAPKTVSDTLAVIRCVLNFSSQKGHPCPSDLHSVRIKQPLREPRILSKNEQNVLYSHLYHSSSPLDLGIMISLLTGLRIGEVCALSWEDVSFSDHTIYVHRTIQRIQEIDKTDKKTKVVITSPKSASSQRIIPIPSNLEEVLLRAKSDSGGFVVSTDGSGYTEPRVLQYHLERTLKKIGLQRVNFHALRHTFATRCIELGFDVKSLSEILGHSNVSITMNRYVHPSMDLKHENMQRLSSLFIVE